MVNAVEMFTGLVEDTGVVVFTKWIPQPAPGEPPVDASALRIQFWVAIIPHTREHTNLGELTLGDRVNLEADILAKHIEKLVKP